MGGPYTHLPDLLLFANKPTLSLYSRVECMVLSQTMDPMAPLIGAS
jgi:hypothetical protein